MIVLKNVTKTYRPKKGVPFDALKGIDLTLPARGMVFVLGKSGSGKTTLLNIIGLLDRPTSGTVEICGAAPQGQEIDDFRNRFSGFVFQDFALLEEETVGSNVALALQLQSGKDVDEKVDGALEKVGLAGYASRAPGELSGGEKQRVAIARALVKDSEMILADEPTGNLDSETGEEIFGILRAIAREKLVVVVSHDRESAEKYADRIIELKDGRVVADSAPEAAETAQSAKRGVRPHLPGRLALRMGWRNFGRKKFKSVATFLVATLALSVLVLAQTLVSSNAERALAKSVVQNDIPYIELAQRSTPDAFAGISGGYDPIRDEDFGKPLAKFDHLESYRLYSAFRCLCVENGAQLAANGFTLYEGAEPLTDDAVYLSDGTVERMFKTVADSQQFLTSPYYYVREGEELVPMSAEKYTAASLVGKTVYVENLSDNLNGTANKEIEIAGIVAENDAYADLFCTKEYILTHLDAFGLSDDKYDPHAITLSEGGRAVKCDWLTFKHLQRTASAWEQIIMQGRETALSYGEITLNAGEIVLGEDAYNALFRATGEWLTCQSCLDGGAVRVFPKYLGETVRLDVAQGDRTILGREYKIVGVAMYDRYEFPEERVGGTIYFGDGDMRQIAAEAFRPNRVLLRTAGVGEMKLYRALRALRYDHALAAECEYSEFIYGSESYQKNIGFAFLAIGAFMVLITLLIVVSLISYSILAQRKEIGVLRALGARAADVTKIYFAQAAILSAVVFALSTAITLVLLAVLNNIFAVSWELAGLVLFGYTPWTVPVLLLGSFGVIAAGTALPLGKISRCDPAEAIKKG